MYAYATGVNLVSYSVYVFHPFSIDMLTNFIHLYKTENCNASESIPDTSVKMWCFSFRKQQSVCLRKQLYLLKENTQTIKLNREDVPKYNIRRVLCFCVININLIVVFNSLRFKAIQSSDMLPKTVILKAILTINTCFFFDIIKLVPPSLKSVVIIKRLIGLIFANVQLFLELQAPYLSVDTDKGSVVK